MNLTLSSFLQLRSLILFLVRLLFWLAILWWGFQTFQILKQLPLRTLEEFGHFEKHWRDFLPLFFSWLSFSGWILFKIVLLALLKQLLCRLPCPTAWLLEWHTHGQVSPMLGRLFASHFRYATRLSLQDLSLFFGYATQQAHCLKALQDQPDFLRFLCQHDTHLLSDIQHTPRN